MACWPPFPPRRRFAPLRAKLESLRREGREEAAALVIVKVGVAVVGRALRMAMVVVSSASYSLLK
jgi:hypothetical protein